MKITHIGLAAAIASVLVATAWAAPQQPAHPPVTKSLQGNPANPAWKSDPYLQALYHITVGAFAKGADRIDVASYQETFYAILRAKAVVTGADPDGMINHMKAIPRQMVDIVTRDPRTLDTYDNFVVALVGPT
jgi:hypothetical protein